MIRNFFGSITACITKAGIQKVSGDVDHPTRGRQAIAAVPDDPPGLRSIPPKREC